jgi:thioredoxin-related protein
VEVLFVSLDNEKNEYTQFVKELLFPSSCDFKKWETKAAQDYYVFSTPTLFLLDKERKIILRPNSIEHVDAWVKYIN